MEEMVNDFLLYYGEQGLTYNEISLILEKTFKLKLRANTIGKRLRALGSRLRKGSTAHSRNKVKDAIKGILEDVPQTVGYRHMFGISKQNGWHVRRDTVMHLMKELDVFGAEFRRRRRIKRRIYQSLGPNFIWHLDGYDKLKPYGFPIHGCIDGYSRKIMWLKVNSTNNDPAVVAFNYVECVQSTNGCPQILQADPGTENAILGALQCMFRQNAQDTFSGIRSYRVVRSKFNQRIEAWWSMLRRNTSEWWISLFKDLETFGGFRRGSHTDILCLRYCFMPVIQQELDKTVERWNNHLISRSRNAVCPHGRPNVLYTSPEEKGGKECLQPIEEEDLQFAFSQCMDTIGTGSVEFDLWADDIFRRNNWTEAENWRDALKQHFYLIDMLN